MTTPPRWSSGAVATRRSGSIAEIFGDPPLIRNLSDNKHHGPFGISLFLQNGRWYPGSVCRRVCPSGRPRRRCPWVRPLPDAALSTQAPGASSSVRSPSFLPNEPGHSLLAGFLFLLRGRDLKDQREAGCGVKMSKCSIRMLR